MDHSRRLSAGRDRVARIAVLFEFVRRMAAEDGRRVDAAAAYQLRPGDVAVAVLWAMLRAAGERARVDYTRETALVHVEVAVADVRRLPPWARPLVEAGRLEIALAPGAAWRPAGYLPPKVRGALGRRAARDHRDASPRLARAS